MADVAEISKDDAATVDNTNGELLVDDLAAKRHQQFKMEHEELVHVGRELAARSGAAVTIVAISPDTGERHETHISPPKNRFFAADGVRRLLRRKGLARADTVRLLGEELGGMRRPQVAEFVAGVKALRLCVLRRTMARKKVAAAELPAAVGQAGSFLSSPAMSADEQAIKLAGHLVSFGSSILNRAGEWTAELLIRNPLVS